MNVKRCLAVASVVFAMLFAVRTNAQDLTPADKEKALKYLETTRKNIEEATKGLSDAQWNFKSAPDRWSVAECVEHIAAASKAVPNPGSACAAGVGAWFGQVAG